MQNSLSYATQHQTFALLLPTNLLTTSLTSPVEFFPLDPQLMKHGHTKKPQRQPTSIWTGRRKFMSESRLCEQSVLPILDVLVHVWVGRS